MVTPSTCNRLARHRALARMFGMMAVLLVGLLAVPAHAKHGTATTKFGTPRLSWNAAPQLHLQPERARLVLDLPSEWMPAPDLGTLGLAFDPNKHWEFHRATRMTRATIGASVHLHVTDSARSIDFGLSLLPRAAVAVLRFDPMARVR